MLKKVWACAAALAAALLWALPAAAGGWAVIGLVNAEDFQQPVAAGEQEVLVQVLQHGHHPITDSKVLVVAELDGQRVESQAEVEFRAVEHHDRAESGTPEATEPVFVARLNLPQAGKWQVSVEADTWFFIEKNPVAFTLEVSDGDAPEHAAAAGGEGEQAPAQPLKGLPRGPAWMAAILGMTGVAYLFWLRGRD